MQKQETMSEKKLKTGDIVVYEGKQYNVKLNGTVVYMRSSEPQFTVKREVAESLPRVGKETLAEPIKQADATCRVLKARREWRAKQVPEDKMGKLFALLSSMTSLEEKTLLDLTTKIADIFVSKNSLGGVYLIRIDEVAGRPIKFFVDDKESSDFVMIKVGKADNYAHRFSQFTFKFTEVLRIDGDTTMEAALKSMIPANWKSYYYNDAMRKETVLRQIGIPGNNGPTEWRIMRKKTFETIAARASQINSLNWQKELNFVDALVLDEKRLELEVGSDRRRANYKILEVL